MKLLAILLLVLGVVGLLLPILPGIPLLLAAALLFTAGSPALRRRLRLAASLRFEHLAKARQDALAAWRRCRLRALAAVRWLLGRGGRQLPREYGQAWREK